ncbi:hypothetical protein BOTBODRAFT_182190 [Botryobasidium botryosum FD-172 SS1]|uniref:Uncharacterized protein n=1 Tax=Botryobasidium botryosum (strain FD-172 SS1) TaxID=930990 RepID=A0A067LRK9_BOTB1|nr:hypothetical protein BOTBODRAFT_182190 [Botryobasidium botryosum FD-172 SS1]
MDGLIDIWVGRRIKDSGFTGGNSCSSHGNPHGTTARIRRAPFFNLAVAIWASTRSVLGTLENARSYVRHPSHTLSLMDHPFLAIDGNYRLQRVIYTSEPTRHDIQQQQQQRPNMSQIIGYDVTCQYRQANARQSTMPNGKA